MRFKPNHIYLLVIAILVSASLTFAQESVSPVLEGMDTEKSGSANDYSYTEGEGNAQRVTPIPLTPNTTQSATQRESAQGNRAVNQNKSKTGQSKQNTSETAEPKPEDSVLGFNFLYYIFQKYKMSDIID